MKKSISLSCLVFVAAACTDGVIDTPASDDSLVVITKRDLDALAPGATLRLSADVPYRFDTTFGSIAFERIVLEEAGPSLDESLRDAGVSEEQRDWIERTGLTASPGLERINEPSSLQRRCTDDAYIDFFWVDPDGSVTKIKLWFCRA